MQLQGALIPAEALPQPHRRQEIVPAYRQERGRLVGEVKVELYSLLWVDY